MLQALIEDQHKREEEIAGDRECRELDFQVERERGEMERLAREREVQERIDAHMETLMKLVEESRTTHASKPSQDLMGVKLVPLTEKDDIKAYLVTFERIMGAHKVDKSKWPHYLALQLTGRAQLGFTALPTIITKQ